MPLYEYECRECGAVTEALRRGAEADSPIACERCGATHTSRKHSVFAVASPNASGPQAPPAMCPRCGDAPGSCGMGAG